MSADAPLTPAAPTQSAARAAGKASGANTPAAAGYAPALAELDDILGQLERSDVDVDVLAAQVRRAAELIAFCRERINDAKMHIDTVVAELD